METPQQPTTPDRPSPAVPGDAPVHAGPSGQAPPAPAGPPPATTAVVPRNRRLRLVLALVGGIMALLCVGGVGIVVYLYDDATKIDRSAPDAAVDNYLRAYLVDRDDTQAALFRCNAPGADLAQLEAYRADIQTREQQFSTSIRVTWSSLTVTTDGVQNKVSTDLRRAIADGSERVSDRWQFSVVDEGGWRVCGAVRMP